MAHKHILTIHARSHAEKASLAQAMKRNMMSHCIKKNRFSPLDLPNRAANSLFLCLASTYICGTLGKTLLDLQIEFPCSLQVHR